MSIAGTPLSTTLACRANTITGPGPTSSSPSTSKPHPTDPADACEVPGRPGDLEPVDAPPARGAVAAPMARPPAATHRARPEGRVAHRTGTTTRASRCARSSTACDAAARGRGRRSRRRQQERREHGQHEEQHDLERNAAYDAEPPPRRRPVRFEQRRERRSRAQRFLGRAEPPPRRRRAWASSRPTTARASARRPGFTAPDTRTWSARNQSCAAPGREPGSGCPPAQLPVVSFSSLTSSRARRPAVSGGRR